MKVDLEDQIRVFAQAYAASLPTLDVDKIRAQPTREQSALHKGSWDTRSSWKGAAGVRSVGSGPLVAVATGLAVLALALAPVILFGGDQAPDAKPSSSASSDTLTPQESDPPNTEGLSITWTSTPIPTDFRIHNMVAIDGRFFGLARDELESDDPRTRLWVSDEGTSWTAIDVDASRFGMRAAYIRHLVAIGDVLVGIVKGQLLDSEAISSRLVVSNDGTTWDPVGIGEGEFIAAALTGGSNAGVLLTRPAEGSADTYDVWRSSDGTTWTNATTETFTGVSGPVLTSIGNRFYLGAAEWVDGQTRAAVWESTNASDWNRVELPDLGSDWRGWVIPSEASGHLFVSTGGRSEPQLWLRSDEASWTEATPSGFEGGSVVEHSRNPILLVNQGGSGGPEDPGMYSPPIFWWSSSGTDWTTYQPADALESEGTIGPVASNGETLVMVYYTHPDGAASIWVGVPAS